MKITKKQGRIRRHARVRAKISGTSTIPRVSVYRSNAHIYVQVIDDLNAKTLFGMSDAKLKGTKSERAELLGAEVAKKVLDMKIKNVLFDRGGYKYHGRVEKVATGARALGLII
jgi:large subunit ribosomal protein L18